jgi:hypothetical protein
MKRLIRYTFNGLTVLSLLLCVVTVVLWVRSYWVADCWVWYPVNREDRAAVDDYFAVSELGVIYARFIPRSDTLVGYPRSPTNFFTRTPDETNIPFIGKGVWRRMGFGYARVVGWSDQPGWLLSFPHAAVVVVSSALPAIWLWLSFGRRRRGAGMCLKCGYDLRATPDRCPACGTV